MKSPFESQLVKIVRDFETTAGECKYDDGSDMKPIVLRELLTRSIAAIERATGKTSDYSQQVSECAGTADYPFEHLANVIGVAKSLLSDLRNGYLKSLEEIIHADVFADYLEMADHLVENGYKDAAAVIAGSTLEAHIWNLCSKWGVNGGPSTKADVLNAELVKAGTYNKLEQKNVTSWLGLRNSAAHGKYNDYDDRQVSLLIASVREFISRHPE